MSRQRLDPDREARFWDGVAQTTRFFMGEADVQRALDKLVRLLDDAHIPYAVVGAMALNEYGYRRSASPRIVDKSQPGGSLDKDGRNVSGGVRNMEPAWLAAALVYCHGCFDGYVAAFARTRESSRHTRVLANAATSRSINRRVIVPSICRGPAHPG